MGCQIREDLEYLWLYVHAGARPPQVVSSGIQLYVTEDQDHNGSVPHKSAPEPR